MANEKEGTGSGVIEVVLRDGQSLSLRPVRADDRERLEQLFYRLSPRSRYLRFHYSKGHVTPEEMESYTRFQPPFHCAYVGILGEGREERIVAVGRWELLPGGESAQIALVVEDAVQERGIGTVLLEHLAEMAMKQGIRRFIGDVLPQNTAMLAVFSDLGFKHHRELEGDIFRVTVELEESEEFLRRHARREHVARAAGVRRLLYPRSVAIIGASRDPTKIGGALFQNLVQGGFTGALYPINPQAASVSGTAAYPSVLEVPDSIDLAVIAVPVELVLPAVEQCGRKGVRSLVVISSGFGEAGPDGAQRERLLREKVLAYGMRLIGPNCLGILNTDPAVRLNATFAATPPSPGNVSIGSQSGALGLALLDAARGASLGIAQFVSIGNRADISNNDLLEFWEDDASTQVILLYVESFGNPRNFSRIARRVSHKKPVIALKAGRSAAGAKAAASHTGALAATDIAVDALFRQAGVIRVDTMKEMLNVAALLAHQPLPRGPRVGILTNAGGPGILAADACEAWGLTVPTLSQETQDRLRALLPAQAAIGNPVDMIASATSEVYRCCLSVLLEDDGLDSLLVIYIPPLVTRPQDIAAAIREAVSSYQGMKPVLVCFLMAEPPAARLDSQPGRPLPFFPYPEDAVQALAHAYRYSQHQAQEEGTVPRFADVEKDNAQHLIATVQDEQQGAWLLPEQAVALLRAYRLPVVDTVVAASAQEAALAAEKLGAPVAMKVRSNTIVHKTDVGGVALGLGSPREVEQAYMAMEQRLREVGRGHEMQGVVLQPMVRGGQELIIGMSHDPSFGPLVMVGFGGVLAELVKDVAFSLHPLTDQDPDHMLHQLKSYPALAGWRGSLPRDIPALKELLLRFSTLIEDFPQIAEIEMNPLLLFEQGKGCLALDARVLLKGR